MVTLIYVHGDISEKQRALFKVAKSRLGVTEPLQFARAVPGCGRVISFTGRPDFFCAYALVRNPLPQAITQVLAWALGAEDRRAHDGADWLSEVLGRTVYEVDSGATDGYSGGPQGA